MGLVPDLGLGDIPGRGRADRAVQRHRDRALRQRDPGLRHRLLLAAGRRTLQLYRPRERDRAGRSRQGTLQMRLPALRQLNFGAITSDVSRPFKCNLKRVSLSNLNIEWNSLFSLNQALLLLL